MKDETYCPYCDATVELDHWYREKNGRKRCKIQVDLRNRRYALKNKDKINEQKKQYYQENRQEIANQHKKHYDQNRSLVRDRQQQYYRENGETIRRKVRAYAANNKDAIAEKSRIYRNENQESLKSKKAAYQKTHPEQGRLARLRYRHKNGEKINAKFRQRRRTDLKFKLACNLRGRLASALRRHFKGKSVKSVSAVRDLGCSVEEFCRYMESKFRPGMTWGNWGRQGWHIDHIKPLSWFDLDDTEQLKVAVHYTNLQPLWAHENMSKGNREER